MEDVIDKEAEPVAASDVVEEAPAVADSTVTEETQETDISLDQEETQQNIELTTFEDLAKQVAFLKQLFQEKITMAESTNTVQVETEQPVTPPTPSSASAPQQEDAILLLQEAREVAAAKYGDKLIPELVHGNSVKEILQSAKASHERYLAIVGTVTPPPTAPASPAPVAAEIKTAPLSVPDTPSMPVTDTAVEPGRTIDPSIEQQQRPLREFFDADPVTRSKMYQTQSDTLDQLSKQAIARAVAAQSKRR